MYISDRTIAQITVYCVYLERKERKMKNSILILSLLIISSVVHTMSTDPGGFESGKLPSPFYINCQTVFQTKEISNDSTRKYV